MIGDYDDDTHFCLKCHSTIIGLDNYVSHRKAGCSKTDVELPKSPLPSQLLPPDESFNLKADDFFSSLELQSSSKKVQSTSGKNFSGILTRSKTTAVIQASAKDHQEIPQSKSGKNVWIGGHQLKLGHGDNQSKLIKAVDNLERRKEDPLKISVNEYEESDVDSEEYDYEDDESSEDDSHDAPPRNHTGGKWKPSSPIQWGNRMGSQDWNVPPPSYTGGKWKPVASKKPVYMSSTSVRETFDYPAAPPPTFTGSKWSQSKATRSEAYDAPPSTHTKGKWKPGEPPQLCSKSASTQEESPLLSPNYTKGKWKPEEPPQLSPKSVVTPEETSLLSPTYTKGKWKPEEPLQDTSKSKADVEEFVFPEMTPDYTKGKWLLHQGTRKAQTKITDDSPLRKSSGMVQYWCRPCNRRLASKIVYERHLESELHFKRTLHDKELDDNLSLLEHSPEKRKRKEAKTTRDKSDDLPSKRLNSPKKRNRKTTYIRCGVCKSKVNKNLMGKHLISHYHCRKGDISTPEAQKMVLDNISEIILQAPFQCGLCKFYFNQHQDFVDHWQSDIHSAKDATRSGYYWCSLCRFRGEDSSSMYRHLISEEHKEVVSVINRSVPIVIKKILPATCDDCPLQFLYNIELAKHCRLQGHKSGNLEGHVNSFACSKCQQYFRSRIALKMHRNYSHGENVFTCTLCNKNYETKAEAVKHRHSKEHWYQLLARKGAKPRKCDYCVEVFEDIPGLKRHLRDKHPGYCPRCSLCGTTFSLPQELSVHLRTKSCSYRKDFDTANRCDKCPFSSSSTSELLFHQVLHTEPLMISSDSSQNPKSTPQYKCPLCQKFYPKSSLQAHLRVHTKERPFVCSICNKAFVRKNNWVFHVKNHERKEERTRKVTGSGDRPYLCSVCGDSFGKKSILQQHMTKHSGRICKCPKLGCVYAARNMAELKAHFKIHSDVKSFTCDLCDYRGKTKQQLNRHMAIHSDTKKFQCSKCSFSARTVAHLKRHARLHTGSKPYSCPHCKYKCNTLENLRKHVLSTNKHRGKCIYECKFCNDDRFQSNFAKEFKAHLITQHVEIFKTGNEAASYVAGIYDSQEDCTIVAGSSSEGETDNVNAERRGPPTVIVVKKTRVEAAHPNVESDPVVTPSTSRKEEAPSDDAVPMFIVSREDINVDNMKETWNLVGSYDVEESGALVPFHSESDTFFGHDFQ